MTHVVLIVALAHCAAAWAEPRPVKNKDPLPPAPSKAEEASRALVPFPAPLITDVL